RGLDGRALAEEDASAEARGAAALGDLSGGERHRLVRNAELARGEHLGGDGRVLGGDRGDLEHSGASKPDVLAELLDGCDRALGRARDRKRAVVAEPGAEPREVRPVAVE